MFKDVFGNEFRLTPRPVTPEQAQSLVELGPCVPALFFETFALMYPQNGGWLADALIQDLGPLGYPLVNAEYPFRPDEILAIYQMECWEGSITAASRRKLLALTFAEGRDPKEAARTLNLLIEDNADEASAAVEKVLHENGDLVQKYRAGKTQLLNSLLGKTLKSLSRPGDPTKIRELLITKLAATP